MMVDVTKVEQNRRITRGQSHEGAVRKAMVIELFHRTGADSVVYLNKVGTSYYNAAGSSDLMDREHWQGFLAMGRPNVSLQVSRMRIMGPGRCSAPFWRKTFLP